MSEALNSLKESVSDFVSLSRLECNDANLEYYDTVMKMHNIYASIRKCLRDDIDNDLIEETIYPAKKAHAASPFVQRMQMKPRGYAGDFETIEYILESKNRATCGSLGYYCEQFILNSPMVQQHRNKLRWQTMQIIKKIKQSNVPLRILYFACGGCSDIKDLIDLLGDVPMDFTFCDHDAEALSVAQQKLDGFSNLTCTYINEHPFKSLHTLANFESYDIILTGGLFDYLKDKHIVHFLKSSFNNLLRKNGSILFTNISNDNPYNVFMNYISDWHIIERNESDIKNLVFKAIILNERYLLDITKDDTGLVFLVQLTQTLI